MTLRERLADLIGGGALSFLIRDIRSARLAMIAADNDATAYQDALRAIIAETDRDPSRPSVKRIARLAREALE